ncbi:hypothetical protein Ancab_016618 [Ancistrocladus abbreviatus]
MGRAPCCDKANVKKGPWSPEEDAKLKSYIEKHGTGGNWIALPQKIGLKRCGKSCRLRWLNYLRPNIKHGGFSEEEDKIICSLYVSIGSRWSIIAAQLPGRTDNDIKNYWNTRLKKKLLGKQRKEYQAAARSSSKAANNINSLKQENSTNQMMPYWGQELQPMPAALLEPNYSNNQLEPVPRFNDHASIRKLLIKLGGKLSQDDQPINNYNHYSSMPNLQYPSDHLVTYYTPEMMNGPSVVNMMFSSAPLGCQFASSEFGGSEGVGINMVQEQCGFPPEIEELMCSNVERSDAGLEYLCWDYQGSMVNTATAHDQPNWGEMSSLISFPVPADCNSLQQETTGGFAFDDNQLRHPARDQQ